MATTIRGDLASQLGMKYLTVRCVGTTPLLVHNVRMADPLDPFTRRLKEVTSKRTKTDADHRDMAEIEWEGSLYYNEELGPYHPAEWVWKSLIGAGGLVKKGASIRRGLLIDPSNRLTAIEYDGPRDAETLRTLPEYRYTALVNGNPSSSKPTRTPRTRPQFAEWTTETRFLFNDSQVNEDDVRACAEMAGAVMGLGDGRSIGFGRYLAEVTVS
jgi:hypothetical protein